LFTRRLSVDFEERDSSHRGVYYRAGELHEEHFVVLSNVAADPDDLPEPGLPDMRVLMEMNATSRPQVIREMLRSIPGLVLLRSREV